VFKVEFEASFCEKYFSKIPRDQKEKILSYIENRIAFDPRGAGKPLKGNLQGNWSARCGDYRIIYTILDEKVIVYVVKIAHRKEVYS
jgi:mRNA interferase RelE/StbE